jgi:glycosyltransferase involved in cell wall biosynthesis
MNPTVRPGLTSIIVPCWNQREFTQLCLPALFRHTRPAWELIVVDNGSTDGTGLYLAGVRDGAAVPVTIISNAENRDIPRRSTRGWSSLAGNSSCC